MRGLVTPAAMRQSRSDATSSAMAWRLGYRSPLTIAIGIYPAIATFRG